MRQPVELRRRRSPDRVRQRRRHRRPDWLNPPRPRPAHPRHNDHDTREQRRTRSCRRHVHAVTVSGFYQGAHRHKRGRRRRSPRRGPRGPTRGPGPSRRDHQAQRVHDIRRLLGHSGQASARGGRRPYKWRRLPRSCTRSPAHGLPIGAQSAGKERPRQRGGGSAQGQGSVRAVGRPGPSGPLGRSPALASPNRRERADRPKLTPRTCRPLRLHAVRERALRAHPQPPRARSARRLQQTPRGLRQSGQSEERCR